ncbi:MAG: hypothetical protein WC055_16740, partial [Melioribacteraceae bacterium]
SEKEDIRSRLIRHIKALKNSNWIIPGGKPEFPRGDMLEESNPLECTLSSVHIALVTKFLAELTDDKDESDYKQFINQKLKNGLCRHEVIARGIPDFQNNYGWFCCNSQYSLRELLRLEKDSFLKEQYRRGLRNNGKFATQAISCYKSYDRKKNYTFTPDWRIILEKWKEQNSISEAVDVAIQEITIWDDACPAIRVEKQSLMASITAALLLMLSEDTELIEKWLPEMIEAINWFDYNRLHYSAFFYVENLIQEIINYQSESTHSKTA